MLVSLLRSSRYISRFDAKLSVIPSISAGVPNMHFATKQTYNRKSTQMKSSKAPSKAPGKNLYRAEKRKVAKNAKNASSNATTESVTTPTAKAEVRRAAKPSTTVSIYVDSELESEVDYTGSAKLAKMTFFYPSRYVAPKEFKYELPTNRVPEFAFVGRCKYLENVIEAI